MSQIYVSEIFLKQYLPKVLVECISEYFNNFFKLALCVDEANEIKHYQYHWQMYNRIDSISSCVKTPIKKKLFGFSYLNEKQMLKYRETIWQMYHKSIIDNINVDANFFVLNIRKGFYITNSFEDPKLKKDESVIVWNDTIRIFSFQKNPTFTFHLQWKHIFSILQREYSEREHIQNLELLYDDNQNKLILHIDLIL